MATDVVGGLSGAASGAMTGAKIGSIIPGVGTAVGAVAGGLIGLFAGGKKASAPTYQPLDISKIISDSRTAASENLKNSIALEQQYRPGTAALRGATDASLASIASGNTAGIRANTDLVSQLGTSRVSNDFGNPLLAESNARILDNLRLGGALGADEQAQAVKAALEKGGAAGISGSGAGRGLVARDLGLTSIALQNQRIAQAQSAGTNQAQLAMQGDQLRLQDYLGRLAGSNTAVGTDLARTGLLAGIVDARALPESGLSPGSIASLYVADNNARNQVNATAATIDAGQRNANLQSLLGLGSMVAGGGGKSGLDLIGGLFNKTPVVSTRGPIP